MIISTCGFGETGSSAVTDYLKECEGVQVYDNFEFTLSSSPDGLEDLAHFLMEKRGRQSISIYAIQRFECLIQSHAKGWSVQTGIAQSEIMASTQDFLDSITQVKYVGLSPRFNRSDSLWLRHYLGDSLIRKRVIRTLEKKGVLKNNIDFYPLDEVRVSIRPENFYEEARKYVSRLLKGMGLTGQKCALDQAFTGPDPAKSFPFFEDPYAIVVDRDPRDVYLIAKKKALSLDRFMPSDDVESFIRYYRLLRENMPYLQENPRILRIRFEELVYEYEKTADKIDAFLSLENRNRKTVFIPELSAANTNVAYRYPELEEDIHRIEEELGDYLFPFENYPDMDHSGKMFMDRSVNNPIIRASKRK